MGGLPFLLALAGSAAVGVGICLLYQQARGPQSVADCVLQHERPGLSNNAAMLIRNACDDKFQRIKLIPVGYNPFDKFDKQPHKTTDAPKAH